MQNSFKNIILTFACCFSCLCSNSQEYKVKSFEITPGDLTARSGKTVRIVESDGSKCALLKVFVADKITGAEGGGVIGDIVSKGMEKWVYMINNSKHVKLNFENHYPLTIKFADYDYPMITGAMVYIVKLEEEGAVVQTPTPTQSPAQTTTTSPTPTATESEDEILRQAKAAYDERYYDKAMTLFKKIPNNAEAQNYMGLMYDFGQGVTQSDNDAVYWYRKAAEQGHAGAQNNLGVCYDNGQGVKKSDSDAVYWYRKAAEQGHAGAQNNLGVCYDFGQGVTQSDNDAVYWYRKAAEQGFADAQNNLGVCYANGQGVKQNEKEAVKWYRKAAEQGNENAISSLKSRGLW